MKRIICGFLFLFVSLSIYGQSLERSLDWIEDKVESLSYGYNGHDNKVNNYTFSYNLSRSTITFGYREYKYGGLMQVNKITVKLTDLDSDGISLRQKGSDSYINLKTKGNRDRVTFICHNENGTGWKGPNNTFYNDAATIYSSDLSGELGEKFVNAFKHVIELANEDEDLF